MASKRMHIVISLLLFVSLSGAVYAAPPGCPFLFCISGIFGTDGNQTVGICAGAPRVVNDFNIWYNGAGPFNITNNVDGITDAMYLNETPYNNTIGLNATIGGGCAFFTLNGTAAPFTTSKININVTIYNKTYADGADDIYIIPGPPPITPLGSRNGTMATANQVSIITQDATGNAIPNTLISAFDNVTKAHIYNKPALSSSTGYWAQHCIGNVSDGVCQNTTTYACIYEGGTFGEEEEMFTCKINATTSFYAVDMVNAKSILSNVTPGTPAVLNLSRSTSMAMVMASIWNPDSQQQMMNLLINQFDIRETNWQMATSIVNLCDQYGCNGPPAFIEPYHLYNISFTYSGQPYMYNFMAPSSGMTGAQILIANATAFPSGSGYKTIIGKVVNETNHPVSNVVVYAQFYRGPGGAFGITFFNSAITDSYGRFSMRVPKTRAPSDGQQDFYFPTYQFYIVSDKTGQSGVPLYFTTVDNNNNKGYFALNDVNVLPPLVLKAGGQVSVNVTLNDATLVISELSKYASLGTGIIRNAVTGKFTMTSMFGQSVPVNMTMSLLSPVGNVIVALFGKNMTNGDPMSGSIVSACFNTSATLTQGTTVSVACNLTQPGYLNLTVYTCNEIFDVNITNCNMDMKAGRFDFWFENSGIVKTPSGQVVLQLNPEGTLLDNLLGFGSESPNIEIPLPAGGYTFEIAPSFEYARFLGVQNKTAFTITPSQRTNMILARSEAWDMRPMFNPSMVLNGYNNIEVSVLTRQGTMLNSSKVTLNALVLYTNKSTASNAVVTFDYNSTRKIFNSSFKPANFGLTAGKYLLMLNATNTTSGVVYSNRFILPIYAFDFQVGLDLGGFSFGTGQFIGGKIFAFNASGPIPTNSSPIIVQMFDENGNPVDKVFGITNITNGMGAINFTAPTKLGQYEIIVKVNASGSFGIATNWIRTTNMNIKTATDRQGYKPNDNVAVTIQVSNTTSGAGIPNATIEIQVDNSDKPAFGITGNDGKVSILLSPTSYAGTGKTEWTFGWHNLKIKISKDTGTDVSKTETWYGFDVRGMDLMIRPNKPAYSLGDYVYIDMFGPPGFTVVSTSVDGSSLFNCNSPGAGGDYTCPVSGQSYAASSIASNYIQLNMSNWTVGHHSLKIIASVNNNNQDFYAGFDVSAYNMKLATDKFSYNLNELVNLTVTLIYPNGSSVPSKLVNASLYKAQPPNDILVNTSSGTTGSTGIASMLLNASQPGFNYIKAVVDGQPQFTGIQVSTLVVSLKNADGTSASSYTAQAGGSVVVQVSTSPAAADDSQVKAYLWAFGNRIDLPTNTTTGGSSNITIGIPALAPAQSYGLEVSVTSPSGEQGFAPKTILTVAGGTSLKLEASTDKSFSNPYKNGDTAVFMAKVTYTNGSAVSNQNVTFEVGSGSTSSQTIGTALTGSSGVARKTLLLNSSYSDGQYFLHVYLTGSTDVQAYTGFMVSSLLVGVSLDSTTHAPGERVVVSANLFNRSSPGTQINATSGFVMVFMKDKGQMTYPITISGSQPYTTNITIPNETSTIGSYPIAVVMSNGQTQGVGFTMLDIKNTSATISISFVNLTGASITLTAGVPFMVNISSSARSSLGQASLRVFSPAASNLIYENVALNLSSTGPPYNGTFGPSITLPAPGVYIFSTAVDGVGGTTTVINVNSTSGSMPEVWTGTNNATANASSFTTSQDVYIMTNVINGTATVMAVETTTNSTLSYSVPLNLPVGSNYYGVLSSSNLASGKPYFVRLDTPSSSGIAKTMFRVS